MRYEIQKIDFPRPRRVRRDRVEGQRAEVYYGRPVKEWPHSWML
jgi:hypothetical protein